MARARPLFPCRGRSAVLRPLPRPVPPAPRPRPPRGVRLARAADRRPGRRRGPAAGRRVPRPRPGAVGKRRVSSTADAAVALAGRRVPRRRVLARHGAVGGGDGRHRPEGGVPGAVGLLPVPFGRRTGFSRLPVGRAAAGNGAAGRRVRPGGMARAAGRRKRAERGGALAGVGPRLQAHLPVRRHQAAERRRDLAEPDRARAPLPDAAASDLDRLVLPQRARRVRRPLGRGPVLHRDRGRVRHPRAGPLPPAAPDRLRPALPAAGPDCRDRQLRLLQPARGRPVPVAARRRGHRAAAAPRPTRASAAGGTAALAGVAAPRAGRRDRPAGGTDRAHPGARGAPPRPDAGVGPTPCSGRSSRSARSTATACSGS